MLAALVGALYWSNRRQPASDSLVASSTTANAKVIALTQDDITKLEVKKKDGDDVVLNRVGRSSWKITSPQNLIADPGFGFVDFVQFVAHGRRHAD